MHWLRLALFLLATSIVSAGRVPAAALYTWTGAAGDGLFSNADNWQGQQSPVGDDSANLVFTNSSANTVTINMGTANITVASIQFSTPTGTAVYSFTGNSQLTITSALSVSDKNSITLGANVSLNLQNTPTLAIGTSSTLTIASPLTGGDNLVLSKTGNGTLYLTSGSSSFSGTISVDTGVLRIGANKGAGSGMISLNGGSLILNSNLIVANDIRVNTGTMLVGTSGRSTLSGTITLSNPSTSLQTASGGTQLTISGNIVQGRGTPVTLTITGGTPVVLSGRTDSNTYLGGTRVIGNTLFFAAATAVPPSGLISADSNSYVGVAFSSGIQDSVINRIDAANFRGVLGFDTLSGNTLVVNESLDVSALTQLKGIATNTAAALNGPIIVAPDAPYLFSGGSGVLTVGGQLAQNGAHGVTVKSKFGAPLTVYLTNDNSADGANTFTGNLNAQFSNVILNGAGALASGTRIQFTDAAYVGFTEKFATNFSDFLNHIDAIIDPNAIVGMDSATASNLDRPDTIDLSSRHDLFYLGTTSKVTLRGNIIPTTDLSNNYNALYLTAIRGGYLNIASNLGGADSPVPSVVIGQANPYEPQTGTVQLSGYNTYTGGTTVLGGTLYINGANALGTGTVDVGPRATLDLGSSAVINNALTLQSGSMLSGIGALSSPGGVLIGSGAGLAPGGLGKAGTIQFLTGLTLAGGGTLYLDLGNSSRDQINISNGLTITASSSNRFVINLYSLNNSGTLGSYGFNSNNPYTWIFATLNSGSITGFDPSAFSINSGGFSSYQSLYGGTFGIEQIGESLAITFTPVPEPGTYALMLFGLGALSAVEIRRRRKVK